LLFFPAANILIGIRSVRKSEILKNAGFDPALNFMLKISP